MFFTIIRPPFAILALLNKGRFPIYAKARRATTWIYSVLIFVCIFAYIIYGILFQGEVDYMVVFGAIIASIILCGVDFHWSKVAAFYSRFPDTRPFQNLNGPLDEKPQYAFQLYERDTDKLD
jgi:nicotinamide riboside transporter PnuC